MEVINAQDKKVPRRHQ